jgi:hypothetical protein
MQTSRDVDPKDEDIVQLRQLILQECQAVALETADAEALLRGLSFQSRLLPERHVWLQRPDTHKGETHIDFEDRTTKDNWDNTVSRTTVYSVSAAAKLVCVWLSGTNKDELEQLIHDES